MGLCKMHLPGNMSGLERIVEGGVLMGEMKPTTHVSGSLPILSKAHLGQSQREKLCSCTRGQGPGKALVQVEIKYISKLKSKEKNIYSKNSSEKTASSKIWQCNGGTKFVAVTNPTDLV